MKAQRKYSPGRPAQQISVTYPSGVERKFKTVTSAANILGVTTRTIWNLTHNRIKGSSRKLKGFELEMIPLDKPKPRATTKVRVVRPITGTCVRKFDSVTEAATHYGCSRQMIHRIANQDKTYSGAIKGLYGYEVELISTSVNREQMNMGLGTQASTFEDSLRAMIREELKNYTQWNQAGTIKRNT